MNLLTFMAKSCHYAQDHIRCPDAWDQTKIFRGSKLECVSYQIACFLAQNTVEGHYGVEFDIILDQLIEPLKSEEEWENILSDIVSEMGGWKLDKRQ
jgi:hypothetical protein